MDRRPKVRPETHGTIRDKWTLADYGRLKVSYHEAGHAVVGHALGWHLLCVTSTESSGQAGFVPVSIPVPFMNTNARERARLIKQVRVAMTVVAAGPVAATLHQRQVEARGFCCGTERRAYEKHWTIRVSTRFPHIPDASPGSDYYRLVRDGHAVAHAVAMAGERFARGVRGLMKLCEITAVDRSAETLCEIQGAEARAEQILKSHWTAVSDLAAAVHEAKSGRLTRRHVLVRFARHGVTSSVK